MLRWKCRAWAKSKLWNLKVHIFKKTESQLLLGSINLPWIFNRLWLISRVWNYWFWSFSPLLSFILPRSRVFEVLPQPSQFFLMKLIDLIWRWGGESILAKASVPAKDWWQCAGNSFSYSILSLLDLVFFWRTKTRSLDTFPPRLLCQQDSQVDFNNEGLPWWSGG